MNWLYTIVSIIVILLVIYLIYRFTRTVYKGDDRDYGSKEIISYTLYKRDPNAKTENRSLYKVASVSSIETPSETPSPTPEPTFPPILPDSYFTTEKDQKAIRDIKENIRKSTKKDFFMCNLDPRIFSYYGRNTPYFIMIGIAIQDMLKREPEIGLYDIGSLLIPTLDCSIFQKDMLYKPVITYEKDGKTVDTIKITWNPEFEKSGFSNPGSEFFNVEPFVNWSIRKVGFTNLDDLGKSGDDKARYQNGVWAQNVKKKSNFAKLVEEKVLYPFSKNFFDGKSQSQFTDTGQHILRVEFDLKTFTKCLLCIWYTELNNSMLLYESGCCGCGDEPTIEKNTECVNKCKSIFG